MPIMGLVQRLLRTCIYSDMLFMILIESLTYFHVMSDKRWKVSNLDRAYLNQSLVQCSHDLDILSRHNRQERIP